MIRVLMGNEDRIELGDAVPVVGKGPGSMMRRVVGDSTRKTSVSQTGDDHPWIMADQPEGGPRRAGLRNRIRPCSGWW